MLFQLQRLYNNWEVEIIMNGEKIIWMQAIIICSKVLASGESEDRR
jgi:hypothetical protein